MPDQAESDRSDLAGVLYDVSDHVAVITLHRPDRLNAFNQQLRVDLLAALEQADADDDVRVVIVTGAGRAFCAGADLENGAKAFNADDGETRGPRWANGVIEGVPRDGAGTITLRLARMLKPVIAAVNGPAVGVGATMTLAMDIRIVSTTARFGFVFTRRGLVPEGASLWFLPRLVGISQAMEWVAAGRMVDATEAREARLVTRVVEPDDLLPAARALAAEIVENTSPVAVATSRRMLWAMLGENDPWTAHRLESQAIHVMGATADVAEGVAAFLEKRSPDFPLRVSRDLPDFMPDWPLTPGDVTDAPARDDD